MKKLFGIIAIVSLITAIAFAAPEQKSVVLDNQPAGIYSLVPNFKGVKGTVTSVQIVNTNAATASFVYLYDSPGASNQYVLAPTQQIIPVLANVTNIYTNPLGVVTTNIYTAITNTVVNVPQTTNAYPVIVPINGKANDITMWVGSAHFNNGITVSNTAKVSVIVNYK